MIDPQLMELLVCPQDKGPLEEHEENGHWLVNPRKNIAYPVTDGIPVLLADQAVTWPLATN